MPKLSETRINQAGIMRCCTSAFEGLSEDDEVHEGQHLPCKHHDDDSGFILVRREIKYYPDRKGPQKSVMGWIWDPAWLVLQEQEKNTEPEKIDGSE